MYKGNQTSRMYNWDSTAYTTFHNWFTKKYKNWDLSFYSNKLSPEKTIPPVFATGNSIGIASEVFFDFLPFEMQKGVLELYFTEFSIVCELTETNVRNYFEN